MKFWGPEGLECRLDLNEPLKTMTGGPPTALCTNHFGPAATAPLRRATAWRPKAQINPDLVTLAGLPPDASRFPARATAAVTMARPKVAALPAGARATRGRDAAPECQQYIAAAQRDQFRLMRDGTDILTIERGMPDRILDQIRRTSSAA